ncbi:hypothetical protein Ndes2526B_g05874 [Nannochloris sp. 'desiccata']
MHAICRQTGQRCSLQVVVGGINLVRSFQTSSINQVQTDEARQAKKERRKRRRDANRQLKTWAEDGFGPQFFTKELKSTPNTSSINTEGTSSDEDRMWRRLLKQSRSSSEAARIRSAWQLWQSTMKEASERASGAFTGNERDSGSNKHNESNKTDRQNKASTGSNEWSAAWEAAFTSSSFSSASSSSSAYSSFNTDYESFWAYGSSDHARRQAFEWQQKQREQAGNCHPNYKRRFEKQESSSLNRSLFTLSKEVRSNLSLLGLATTHLPTAIELKTAFRTSALVYHPDRHPDPKTASTAGEKFKQLQAAFSFLKPMVVV